MYLCGASAFTSCSNNDDNPVVDNSFAEKIVGKWIHADTDGEVVELTAVTVSGDDLRFTAKTTLSKDGQVTATYGPRQEHFTRTEADYTEAVVGLWEITFTSDNPEYESSEPYRELYRSDGIASFYDLIDGQWVEKE